jgi:hypothetical protein
MVEFRNKTPKVPIRQRQTDLLMEDLCLALRNVAVLDYDLPSGARVLEFVSEVQAIYTELESRAIELDSRIVHLSTETGWKMQQLLSECVEYPAVIPWLRETDGIRRQLRCLRCRCSERPASDTVFWVCDNCLKDAILALKERQPKTGILLFRAYSPELRCSHADSETPLCAFWQDEVDLEGGFCQECIDEELGKRSSESEESLSA